MSESIIQIIYLVAAVCFILSLKWLNTIKSSRRGVIVGVIGMLFAVAGTLLQPSIEYFTWLAIAIVLGSIIGVPLALIPMTKVPQRTALSHAFGALAVTMVGTAEYYLNFQHISTFVMA
jgi:NAD(P) transhydrogenase subunit beta